MTPQTELEIKGNFFTHPFAELVIEIGQGRLNGSLRVSDKDKKCVVYFRSGQVVFAVSNSRTSRLFEILLRKNRLSKTDITKIPNFANDFEFAASLEQRNLLTKVECSDLFAEQVESIFADVLAWRSGDWIFSSLARIRDGLVVEIDARRLLVEYGRHMSTETMLGRFRSLDETFRRSQQPEADFHLTPDEAFVLSRANEDGALSAANLVSMAAMSETKALHSIYTLWLGGLLLRTDWQPAISASAAAAMRNAKLEIRTEAKVPVIPQAAANQAPGDIEAKVPEKQPEIVVTLEEYLERVENAETHYDILGVDIKADISELKRAYFSLAKMFHPDRFHSEGGETLKRIQHAFTELAQAHETLKNEETREIYDYRMRKELTDRDKRQSDGADEGDRDIQAEQAADQFDRGFSLLMDDEHEAALPFLARSVHFSPKTARYHAYYGKALAADPKKRHKAEAEMQTALKLEPNNATFRILLAEFFIQFNLLKRAEGELTRLLAVAPGNREARELLDTLQR